MASRAPLSRVPRWAPRRLQLAASCASGLVRRISARLDPPAAGAEAAAFAAPALAKLAAAMGVAQHHDAVSGTAKQHVTDDYAFRISAGLAAVAPEFHNMLAVAIQKQPVASTTVAASAATASATATATTSSTATAATTATTATATTAAAVSAPTMSQCPLLNVSACPATESLLSGQALAMLVYNPLAWARTEHVRLPVSSSAAGGLRVIDAASGLPVPSAIMPAPEPRAPLAGPATTQLAFSVSVPPLSVSTFFIEAFKLDDGAGEAGASGAPEGLAELAEAVVYVSGESGGGGGDEFVLEAPAAAAGARTDDDGRAPMSIVFDAATGAMSLRTTTAAATSSPNFGAAAPGGGGVVVTANVSIAWYRSHEGGDGFSPSGAYVFRPAAGLGAEVLTPTGAPLLLRSAVVSEARQSYGAWASLTTRLWAGEAHAEVEWTVGPIPVEADGVGKEVIVRYSTGLNTEGTWATDANGRDMQRRHRDHRDDWTLNVSEPVAGNYVPCGSVATLTGDPRAALHVLPDRSQGVASIQDGQLEAMVGRAGD
mmetsp:Transcript_18225/g.45299  ORF Transcript_18225/g.45299 Transcript_18225/m.45299 type:complete len:543 (-) Transcript_18225:104-1732(-)